MPHILLLGGHGAISLLLTRKLLTRGVNVTSLIRTPTQEPEILSLGKDQPGKVNVLIHSLEDVKSDEDAKSILDKAGAEWIVWSAGAGGNGGPSRTEAIDKTACIHLIRAAISTPSITKFLVVSALSSRRQPAPWWTPEDTALVDKLNKQIIPVYYSAKLAADDVLTILGSDRAKSDPKFSWISLRPGRLSDDPEVGKVSLGKTKAIGEVSREDVAEVAALLLVKGGVNGWIDIMDGEEAVNDAVERVIREKVDSVEGESLGDMRDSIEKL